MIAARVAGPVRMVPIPTPRHVSSRVRRAAELDCSICARCLATPMSAMLARADVLLSSEKEWIAAVRVIAYRGGMSIINRLALLAFAAVAACSNSGPNAIEAATSCIRKQVPKGMHVSELRARAVLKACQPLLSEWSRFSIEHSFRRRLDRDNRLMMDAFNEHQGSANHVWLKILSEEYANAHVDYD